MRSSIEIFYPLFVDEILFNDFKKLSIPFVKLNSGVYSIQFWVKKIRTDGSKIVKPKEIFQSVMSQDTNAMRKMPIEKLTCRKIIIL